MIGREAKLTAKADDSDDKELAAFSQSVGSAVLSWQTVEFALAGIFFQIWGWRRYPSSSIVWYSLRHIRTQYNITNRLLEERLKKKPRLLKKWQSISGRLNISIRDRNRLVHGTAQIFEDTDGEPYPTVVAKIEDWMGKLADTFNTEKLGSMPEVLTHQEINSMANRFDKLKDDLFKFQSEMRPRKKRNTSL